MWAKVGPGCLPLPGQTDRGRVQTILLPQHLPAEMPDGDQDVGVFRVGVLARGSADIGRAAVHEAFLVLPLMIYTLTTTSVVLNDKKVTDTKCAPVSTGHPKRWCTTGAEAR